MPPLIKNVHVLISKTCGYVTFHGKGEFEDAIKLKILKLEDYLGYSRWPQHHHEGLYKW